MGMLNNSDDICDGVLALLSTLTQTQKLFVFFLPAQAIED